MEIKILESTCCGGGLPLKDLVKNAVNELGISAEIIEITDFQEVMQYGVMSFPAIIADGKVIVKGNTPSQRKLVELISKEV